MYICHCYLVVPNVWKNLTPGAVVEFTTTLYHPKRYEDADPWTINVTEPPFLEAFVLRNVKILPLWIESRRKKFCIVYPVNRLVSGGEESK